MRAGQEATVGGERLFVIRAADYARLLQAAEADDMIVRCEKCGAWLDRDDPALSSLADFTACWAYVSSRDVDAKLCRRDRVCEP